MLTAPTQCTIASYEYEDVYSKIHFSFSTVYWTMPSGNQLQTHRSVKCKRTWDIHVQSNLLLSALNRVRAVADVTANSEGVVTTDGAYRHIDRSEDR